jgi:hypothetical protein
MGWRRGYFDLADQMSDDKITVHHGINVKVLITPMNYRGG